MRKLCLKLALASVVVSSVISSNASAQPGSRSGEALEWLERTVGVSPARTTQILQSLKPQIDIERLKPSNDLLLQAPDVITPGPVAVRTATKLPRVDGMWLVSLSPNPDQGRAQFWHLAPEPGTHPDIRTHIEIHHTQTLLLIVRSAGNFVAIKKQVKVAEPLVSQSSGSTAPQSPRSGTLAAQR
jgi:predicted secreted protein